MASTPGQNRMRSGKSAPSTPNRDALVKVTFSVRHDEEVPNTDMYVTGSLPMLGSWDARRARKLARADDGTWNLAVYIPDRVEFMYQYLLVVANEDSSAQPEVVWTGRLERKCRVEEASSTPKGKQLVLDDDTAGDAAVEGTPAAKQMIKFDPLMPELNKETIEQKLEVKQVEIDNLLEEREHAQMELQKLKDIVGAVDNPDDYRKRQSYLPDCSSQLYDTVREIQAKVQRKLQRMQEVAVISEETTDDDTTTIEAIKVELRESEAKCVDLRSRLEEAEDKMREMQAAHEAEKVELRDYYQTAMGELDEGKKAEADARIKEEENRTLMQSSVRVVAGQLDDIKSSYSSLRDLMSQLRGAFLPAPALDLASSVAADGDVEMADSNIEMHEAPEHGFSLASKKIASSVEAVTGVLEGAMEEARGKMKKEVAERKRLHNLVQELRGNIRVFCRVRPLSAKNLAEGATSAVGFPSDVDITVETVESGGKAKTAVFQYDKVFDPSSTQAQVFEETQPLVVSVLDGYNVCIFAYGQTGSGKTHTMQGYDGDAGVNTRALEQLFLLADERKGVYTYDIKVSLCEIYNETIRDLLEPKDKAGDDKKLDVKIAPEGGTTVPGMACVQVASMEDVMALLATGERNRSVGCTNMNEHSSRSHMILAVHTCGTSSVTGAKGYGKLNLIDLAGSERVGKSGATGDRLKEAQNINKSLSALGDCVQSLVSKSKHVPFRNSKLTYLLQDSLGGESKTLMFVCASPCTSDATETACSLHFAARVRNVELGPAKRKGGADALAEVKLKEKDRELEAVREEKRLIERRASVMQAEVKHLQDKLHDAQSEYANVSAAAAAAAAAPGVGACAGGSDVAAMLAQKDTEINELRLQLASAGGGDALNTSGSSWGRRSAGSVGGRPSRGSRGASGGVSRIPKVASAAAASRSATAGAGAGGRTPRKRAPPVSTDSAALVAGGGAEALQSPAKKTRLSANKENTGPSLYASAPGATPSRGGRRTPGKEPAGAAKSSESLDDRIAQLRQKRQQQAALQAAASAAATKSVGFAGVDESDASDAPARSSKRPLTAPARAGSRLLAGATRVTSKSGKAAVGEQQKASRLAAASRAEGGWR